MSDAATIMDDPQQHFHACMLYEGIKRLIIENDYTPRRVMIDLDIMLVNSVASESSEATREVAAHTRRLAAAMSVSIFELHRQHLHLTCDEYLKMLHAENGNVGKLVDAAIAKHCGKFR